MNRWTIASVLLAGLVLALIYLEPDAGPEPTLPLELQEEPDLYMEDATITQYQKDGSIKYQLKAAEIKHFEQQNLTRLVAPNLIMHDPKDPPWDIAAREGVITRVESADGSEERVDLRDDVVLTRRHRDARFVTLATSQMYIYPDRKFAESDQAVIISTHTGRSEATGFSGDLNKNWMRLESSPGQRVHIVIYGNSLP